MEDYAEDVRAYYCIAKALKEEEENNKHTHLHIRLYQVLLLDSCISVSHTLIMLH